MASSVIGALRIVLGLDSAEFTSGARGVQRQSRQVASSLGVIETSAKAAQMAVRSLAAGLGIASVGAAGKAYLDLADESKNLTAQLKLATAQTGNFGQAQTDVKRIAEASRTGLADTADLYATLQRNAREIGITQSEVARITETVSKSFQISGASAAEAAGGMRQFLQGLQSGTLRGEELNSVLENAPRLARALADGLGVTIGELRRMGQEGELTGGKVSGAILKASAAIDTEFREMPKTFDQSMTQIHNAAIVTFGAFDQGGEFSTALANFVSGGTKGFADLEKSAENFGITVRANFEGYKAVIGAVTDQVDILIKKLNQVDSSVTDGWIGSALKSAGGAADTLGWGNPVSMFHNAISGLGVFQEAENKEAKRLRKAAVDRKTGGGTKAPGGPVSSGLNPADAKKAEAARKKAEKERIRSENALQRFYQMLTGEQMRQLSFEQAITTDAQERARLEHERIDSDHQAYLLDIQSRVSTKELTEAQAEQLRTVEARNAQLQHTAVNWQLDDDLLAQQVDVRREGLQNQMELLDNESSLARTASQRRALDLQMLDLQTEMRRLALEETLARHDSTDAQKQIAQAQLNLLDKFKAGQTAIINQRNQSPMASYLDSLPRSADEAREALEQVQADGINGIVDGLAQAATGAESLGDVFKNVANSIIADLIRIQLQKALVGGLSNALGGLFGGGDSLSAFSSSMNTDALGQLSAKFGSLPGFATGGSFKVGGAGGIDKNLVAFRATRGEMVDIRKPGNDNSGMATVHVVPSPYFDVHVQQGAAQVAAPMAMRSAAYGSADAQQSMARRARRTIR